MRKWWSDLGVVAGLSVASCPSHAAAQTGSPHTFNLTYRSFGPVTSTTTFKAGDGYEARSEGCYAKHSNEAICGFTIHALRGLTITNAGNASHASGSEGPPIRTCCMFVQGDDRGFPIVKTPTTPAGVATLVRALKPGETVGFMLRVPSYKAAPPLAGVTFSAGHGDVGVSFATQIVELP